MMHIGFDDWQTVNLPMFPGGGDITTQATDLLCIHKANTNPQAAREYIKLMLSPQIQDFIGKQKDYVRWFCSARGAGRACNKDDED